MDGGKAGRSAISGLDWWTDWTSGLDSLQTFDDFFGGTCVLRYVTLPAR